MKNLILFAVFIFSGINNFANAQCKQMLVYSCQTVGDDIFLKDFNTRLEKSENYDDYCKIFGIFLDKGTRYRFYLCTPSGFDGKVILNLYQADLTEILASTFDIENNKDYEIFDYVCQKSGLYYISIKFKDDVEIGTQTCAVGILSFVGKN
jgi:hypothetical protein